MSRWRPTKVQRRRLDPRLNERPNARLDRGIGAGDDLRHCAYPLRSASIARGVGDILVLPVFVAQILGPRKVLLRTHPADKV